jgi:D-alanyl-D-alanine carboxypeptidase
VSAAALHLARAGKLDLDAKAATFLDGEDWFARLPNAKDFTVRELLRHQSGLPRYVFEPAFWELALAEKDKVWKPAELLSYVFDAEPLFAAGEGWSYSDTSYIVAGMVLEKVSGRRFYEYVEKELLQQHALADTVPSDSRRIPKLVQGHVVTARRLGVPARFLARWARILYSGRAFEGEYLDDLLDAVPAEALGPGVRYGLGVMLRETELGPLLGHDGFMPGYLSSMGWFPDIEIAAAFQVNTDDATAIGATPYRVLVELAKIANDALR